MKNEQEHATKPATGAANQHSLTQDEHLMRRAGELALKFCAYLRDHDLICDGRYIVTSNGAILHDLKKPSAKFQALFTWITGVSLSLKLGKLTLELVKMSGFAAFDQTAFPDRSASGSCKLTAWDLLPPGTSLYGGNA
jgi:hypothetical protein